MPLPESYSSAITLFLSNTIVTPIPTVTQGKLLALQIIKLFIFILGSCLALYLTYFGCCVWFISPTCSDNGCYCDQVCHILNDCCSDVTDIGCHPIPFSFSTFTSTKLVGKTHGHTMNQCSS